jgi:CubicO group peptidase (beta-lactamase class C family)
MPTRSIPPSARRPRCHPLAAALAAAALLPLLPLRSQTAAANTGASVALTAAQVETIAQTARERFGAVGLALAVVQDGEVLAEIGVGERAPGLPMTPTTQCNIASCTKAFTAAAVALLVQAGKLGWDDLVVEHVPEFRLSDPWITAHMTVRDLLSHRCGLVTFAGDLLWYGSDYDDAEVLRRAARLPIPQRFREQFGYQNLMYAVAGTVVARVSGESWEQFVESRLMGPLGMTASRASASRLPADAEKALPHIDGQSIADHDYVACKPAASIYASVHELTAWLRMLLAGGKWQEQSLLQDASLRELWRPHVSTAPAGAAAGTADFRAYGMGWFLSLERGQKLVEHDGGMPGFLSKVALVPAERFGFAVVNNSNDGVLNEAVKRALFVQRAGGDGLREIERLRAAKERIADRDRRQTEARIAQRRTGTRPSLPLQDYAGSYADDCYGPAQVAIDGDHLTLELVPSRSRLRGAMQHWHLDTFRVDWPDRFLPFALVRFELDHAGRAVAFRIDCPIADFDFAALHFRREPASAK